MRFGIIIEKGAPVGGPIVLFLLLENRGGKWQVWTSLTAIMSLKPPHPLQLRLNQLQALQCADCQADLLFAIGLRLARVDPD